MGRTGKTLIGLLVLFVLVPAVAWLFRLELILLAASIATRVDAGPTHEVNWEQGPSVAQAPADQRPPNIVIIYADDLGINDISTFGGGLPGLATPRIDQLAAEGVQFSQAYAGNGTCAPSRAILLTGRYPTRHGFAFTPGPGGMGRVISMLMNDPARGMPHTYWNPEASEQLPPMEAQGLPASEVTLAEMLRDHGYHTAHIGKWHLGTADEFHPNAQGFSESLLQLSGLYLPEDSPDVVNIKVDDPVDRFLWAAMDFAASFNGGEPFRPGGYLTDWWTDEAVNVIRANRNRPFFLYFAHWAPHAPFQAAREDYEALSHIESEPMRVYAAMIRALDRSVGRVLEALQEEGLDDNTIVIFSSDNGGAGYIGLPDLNAPFRGWKGTFFEGGIRTPLFLRWPAGIERGSVVTRPVSQLDLVPTLVAAAGASLPDGVIIDGIDILDPDSVRPDDALFWQTGYYHVVRQGDWKLQVNPRREKTWLYNLADDPTEQVNLVDSHTDKVAELQALLAKHHRDARPALYPFTTEAPTLVDKPPSQGYVPGDEYVYWPN